MAGSDYSGVPWAFFAHPDNEESCANARALTVSLAGHDDIHVVDLEVPAAVMLQTSSRSARARKVYEDVGFLVVEMGELEPDGERVLVLRAALSLAEASVA
jgi:hypothetical protein